MLWKWKPFVKRNSSPASALSQGFDMAVPPVQNHHPSHLEEGCLFSDYTENICFVSHVVDAIISKTVINEVMV